MFDKPVGAKWPVPAHQDVVHPVRGVAGPPEFGEIFMRDGISYARFPQRFLGSMVSLRLHCDDCSEKGALQVVPGSHSSTLSDLQVRSIPSERFVPCEAAAGMVLIMRPLLIHRSGPSAEGARRRVLHVTLSGRDLPHGLDWTWSD